MAKRPLNTGLNNLKTNLENEEGDKNTEIKIYRRRPRRNKLEFSFVGNDCRPSRKSGTRRENRNAPDSPDLSVSIPDRGYLRFH